MSRPLPWLHAFLDVPAEHAETAARFWAAASGAEIGAPWPGHPEFRSLDPATGSRYLHVQRHSGPPRLHLDLITPQVDAEAARLVALGAVAHARFRWWQVLRSPGGLPFCLVEETPGRSRPEPVRWPGGHRSRVARLVVDAPTDRYDAEWAFWAAATGWSESTDGRRPEFRSLLPPDSSPLQLLLHRLDERDTPVRAHLDIDTDDLHAEVRRLVALGAAVTAEHNGSWVTMVDPIGLPFCTRGCATPE